MKYKRPALGRAKHALLAFAAAVAAAQAQAPIDVRVALVIGNAAYAAPATLTNPGNDARAMSDTLRGLGFEVHEVRDGSLAQMRDAVAKVRDAMRAKQGVGMLYYAGHGLQLDWRNYMVPVDARLAGAADVPQQALDVEVVLEAFKAAGNRMNIVVLDACRDNPFPATATGKGLAQVDAPPGTLLAYATAPGNVASDGDGSNGLYTRYLLQELVKPQSRIEDVFKRTRYAVRKASNGRQIPWEATSLEDDFMFNAGKLVAVPRPDQQRERERLFAQERADWQQVKDNSDVNALYAFLAKYPSGNYSELASSRLESLQKPQIRPQPGVDGRVSTPFAERHREGDRYEIVWKDELTGQEVSRQTLEVRASGPENFDLAVVRGTGPNLIMNRAGFTLKGLQGSYDPPLPTIPGGEFKLGNRAALRSEITQERGNRQWIDLESRIVSREKIRLPFGEVDTWRVQANVVAQSGVRVNTTLWYDPDWGMALRTRQEVRRPVMAAGVPIGSHPPEIRVGDVVARSRRS